jgi:hypothetical protein
VVVVMLTGMDEGSTFFFSEASHAARLASWQRLAIA